MKELLLLAFFVAFGTSIQCSKQYCQDAGAYCNLYQYQIDGSPIYECNPNTNTYCSSEFYPENTTGSPFWPSGTCVSYYGAGSTNCSTLDPYHIQCDSNTTFCSKSGVCTLYGTVGQGNCSLSSPNSISCSPNLFCSIDGLCLAYSTVGGSCSSPNLCDSTVSWCNTATKTCEALVTAGGKCTSTNECTNTTICYNGICVRPLSLSVGEPCTPGMYLCAQGLFCNSTSNVCETQLSPGTPCSTNTADVQQCQWDCSCQFTSSGYVCALLEPQAEGFSCTEFFECSPGLTCNNQICMVPLTNGVGSACNEDSDCFSDATCQCIPESGETRCVSAQWTSSKEWISSYANYLNCSIFSYYDNTRYIQFYADPNCESIVSSWQLSLYPPGFCSYSTSFSFSTPAGSLLVLVVSLFALLH